MNKESNQINNLIKNNEHGVAQGLYEAFMVRVEGESKEFASGMHRNSAKGKPRYDLLPTFMLKRWANLMSKGAEVHGERNWEKANTEEELSRFRESAFRHFMQWFEGEVDEDHASAVMFNIAGAEMVKKKLKE